MIAHNGSDYYHSDTMSAAPSSFMAYATTCDSALLSELMQERLDFETRVALLSASATLRRHLTRHCHRTIDTHVTYEAYVRQCLRTTLPVIAPTLRDDAYQVTPPVHMPVGLPNEIDDTDVGHFATFINSVIDASGHTKPYTCSGTRIADDNAYVVMECTLRPTTEMLVPDLAQAALPHEAYYGQGLTQLVALHYKLSPAVRTGPHVTRAIGIVTDPGTKRMKLDSTSHPLPVDLLHVLGHHSAEPVLVTLTTPLRSICAHQKRPWLSYMGRLRASLRDNDPIGLEHRLQHDDSLAIRGLFLFSRKIVAVHAKTGRATYALSATYMGQPMDHVVHRVL